MVSAVLISTAVTGALLVAIVAAITGEKRWRPVPAASEFRRRVRDPGERGALAGLANSLATWELIFVVLLVVASSTVLLAAGGSAGSVMLFGAFLGVVLLGFLVLGVYHFATERGHSVAMATAEAAVTFGFLLLLGITIQLLVA